MSEPATKKSKTHAYQHVRSELEVDGEKFSYYSLPALNDARIAKLPVSIRVILESAVRSCDGERLSTNNVDTIVDWSNTSKQTAEIQFMLSRVILQDFTGVPALVDLAAMRDAVARLGGDPEVIQPRVPVDLVIDHSVQVDRFGTATSLQENLAMEFKRNRERFVFLKWGANAFENLTIVPPGCGIVHQVNLEYLSRCVFNQNNELFFDTLVGTDSHTPMVNGLGVLGWGVGGIEAEAAICGLPMSIVLPEVVGFKLTGELPAGTTATDLVLTITRDLRKHGVVGKFVEFFGPGVAKLAIADRATISNMAPEYGATVGFFPIDAQALDYLRATNRDEKHVKVVEAYLRAQGIFRDYLDAAQDPEFSSVVELDMSTVVPSISGPKRPHDFVALSDAKSDFESCLTAPVGFKGFALPKEVLGASGAFTFQGKQYTIGHGAVAIAAITSCTNTSNPSVMLAAGLLARNANKRGLTVNPFVKTSLAPGSGVVTEYLQRSGLMPEFEKLGFYTVGYGCTTCIGNSGPLPEEVAKVIEEKDLVVCGVLSGNRNFEGRIHPHVRANYLASPPLVVLYAIAGTMLRDFDKEPVGVGSDGKEVFMRDIWPSAQDVAEHVRDYVLKGMFKETYAKVTRGTKEWNELDASNEKLYPWSDASTYIRHPPFFESVAGKQVPPPVPIKDARCLAFFGDSVTTDHISPAGTISRRSPAARYLESHGVAAADFNSYGSRRGNDQVMARGTFANIRLRNRFLETAGPKTVHLPSGDVCDVFDAAERYQAEKTPLIIIAGHAYGTGSSRDWAAKGVWMQGVKAVIAASYERIHRSNLVLFGALPLEFLDGESADTLKLTGKETYSIELDEQLKPGQRVKVKVDDRHIEVKLRIDTNSELNYYLNGGVLNYVIRDSLK